MAKTLPLPPRNPGVRNQPCTAELDELMQDGDFDLLADGYDPQPTTASNFGVLDSSTCAGALRGFCIKKTSRVMDVDRLQRVRMNLPRVEVPPRLSEAREELLFKFQEEIMQDGYLVTDRATKAFFAIGLERYGEGHARDSFLNFMGVIANIEARRTRQDHLIALRNFFSNLDGLVRQPDGELWLCRRLEDVTSEEGQCWGKVFSTESAFHFVVSTIMSFITFEDICRGITILIHPTGHLKEEPNRVECLERLSLLTAAPPLLYKGVQTMLAFSKAWPVQINHRIFVMDPAGDNYWHGAVLRAASLLPKSLIGRPNITGPCRKIALEDFKKITKNANVPIHLGGSVWLFDRLSVEEIVEFKFVL